jgi:hypothetical protein
LKPPRAYANSFGGRNETSWTSTSSMDVFIKRYLKTLKEFVRQITHLEAKWLKVTSCKKPWVYAMTSLKTWMFMLLELGKMNKICTQLVIFLTNPMLI